MSLLFEVLLCRLFPAFSIHNLAFNEVSLIEVPKGSSLENRTELILLFPKSSKYDTL